MKPLTIELAKGQKQKFAFLGWKDDGLSFYATEIDGQPAVITPASAYPRDFSTDEPYRFPMVVPLEIIPKQFEVAWSDHHRNVLRRWREVKLAEVDAETQETLFPFDAPMNLRPKRAPGEINQERQKIENRYRELIETPLVELLDPIPFQYLLEDFRRGRWADEMGEDFRVMMTEAGRFNTRWKAAYNGQGDHQDYQRMLRALRSVRLVMRGDDKVHYPLTGVGVRFPTDREAQAYVLMKQVMQGASAQPSGDLEGVTQAHVLKKLDQVLVGVETLTELAGEQAVTRDKWTENPLGSREGSADYLLTMLAAGIKGERAAALVYFGYGTTQEKCAAIAKVSVKSIKRDLIKARKTQYATFFARSRRQKLEALQAMKKPDNAFARMKQLAKEAPDELRAMIDQMIAKAQKESGDGSAWENTVAGLS